MLKGSSTLKALDVRLRLLRPFIETRSAGKCKLHNLKPMASLEHLRCSKIERCFYYHCSGCGRQQQHHPQQLHQRSFSNSIHRSYITFNDFRTKNRWYTKKELVGYSMQDMYSVVSDVSNYHKFVPYVKRSHVHSQESGGGAFKADLIVGFPPLNEAYTSRVTLVPPSLVKSECHDGRLFNYLLNEWRFRPGLKDIPNSCVLDFKVSFEFKSLLHSNVANIFFDLICDQMENAFIQEVQRRSGPPSIRSHVLTSQRS